MAKRSSGVAKAGLVTGITGAVALGNQLLGGEGLNLFGGNGRNAENGGGATKYDIQQAERISALQADNALLRSETATDAKLIDLFKNTSAEFDRRDQTLVGMITAEAEQHAEIRCLNKTVAKLEAKVEEHGIRLCEIGTNERVQAERMTALAHSMNTRIDTERNAFYTALNCERDQRVAGDAASINYVNCNTVPNKKVLDPSHIFPGVVTENNYYRGALNYFNAGGTTPIINPSPCCVPPAAE